MNSYKYNANRTLEKEVLTFAIESNKPNITDHFPKKIKNDNIFFASSPPSCPPTYDCSAQFGDIFLMVNKPEYHEELATLLKGKIAYKTTYNDSNIIINLSELKRNIFPVEKCNRWYANKLPIPYFESYDFGQGKKEVKKEIDGEPYFNYIYTIPSDLQIYVIQSEAGNFWKENCNEKRPEALKEWQHGYSKGFAISEEKNIIIYWSMIW